MRGANGTLIPREVVAGLAVGTDIEIVDGLQEGDVVGDAFEEGAYLDAALEVVDVGVEDAPFGEVTEHVLAVQLGDVAAAPVAS